MDRMPVGKRMWRTATLFVLTTACAPSPASQNPSPMVESARAHERLERGDDAPGRRVALTDSGIDGLALFVPERHTGRTLDLVVHFHGAAWVAEQAVSERDRPAALVAVHLGAGSSVYARAFTDPAVFLRLVEDAARAAGVAGQGGFASVLVSAFSAGYGAVREILRSPVGFARVDAVLLLDGLHAAYQPERRVLAEGGALDTASLAPFVRFAEAAVRGEKLLVITHSEIFPGTFASTTETADHILGRLALRRRPVLAWGPLGMQQISEAGEGGFRVLGFAGNTAPDHVDHLHALPHFLGTLDPPPPARRETPRP